MPLRRKRAGADEVAHVEQAIANLAQELQGAEAQFAGADTAVSALGDLEAAVRLGEAPAEELDRKRVAALEALGGAEREVDRLRSAQPALERHLETARAKALAEASEAAREQYRAALVKRNAIAAAVAPILEQARTLIEKLGAARAHADDRRANLSEIAGDGHYADDLGERDEPDWTAGLEKLVETITAGPLRPLEHARKSHDSYQKQQANRLRAHANQLVENAGELPAGPTRDRQLAQLPEPLRTETNERIDKRREERRAAIERVHGSIEGSPHLGRLNV